MFGAIDNTPGRSPYDLDAEDLSDDDLIDAIAISAAHIAVAECHHVLLVAELDRRGIWGGPGTRSAAHWLNWRCGTSLSTAREQVRVGRALQYLPQIRQAFASGQISYSKARAITRIATNDTEQELLNMAR